MPGPRSAPYEHYRGDLEFAGLIDTVLAFVVLLAGILAISTPRHLLDADAIATMVGAIASLAMFGADPTEPLTALVVGRPHSAGIALVRGWLS